MRKVGSADPSLLNRLDVAVDSSAEPADWDDALAKFLLAYVRKQATRSAGTAAAEPVVLHFPSADERHLPCSSK